MSCDACDGLAQLALVGLVGGIARSIAATVGAASANRLHALQPVAAKDDATGESDSGPATVRTAAPVQTRAAEVRLNNRGDSTIFPTYFFGATLLGVRNDGSTYGEAHVQTVLGPDPEWLPLSPGETKTVRRWWWGVPIRVTNSADSPLTAWTR
ncbi:hypothetical protein [Streptomyces sp. NPDC057302]|uniref:hypothetical protein n=1 Tax=Streptomyces sp. NPDC057302 TaxID=3346094 RepID=UPI0036418D36